MEGGGLKTRLLVDDHSYADYKKPCSIKYEWVFWGTFFFITFWTILDRFTFMTFPMNFTFKPLGESLGALGVPIPKSVLFFDIYSRITGRLFLVVLNFLFITQCKVTETLLMEYSPKWLRVGDVRTTHNRAHYMLGLFFMAIPMMIHCWLVFLPPLAGVPISTAAKRPPNKVTPFIFPTDGDTVASMFVSHDDLFRIVLMTVLFGVLFPLSMSNKGRGRYFTPTQWLHIGAAFLFTIDMIRRSPHAQVFSSPVILWYFLDRAVGYFWFRKNVCSIIHKEVLDENYMVLFLYNPQQKTESGVGATYYLTMEGKADEFDIGHPYVSFSNRGGEALLPQWRDHDVNSASHKFYLNDKDSGKKQFNRRATVNLGKDDQDRYMSVSDDFGIQEETDDVVFFGNWNVAFIVQIHTYNREPSFTTELRDQAIGDRIKTWGPYKSEYGELVEGNLPPIVLIATGAGCGPVLDFFLYVTRKQIVLPYPVTVYFSTNSVGLFQFFTDLTCSQEYPNWTVNAHLTSTEDLGLDEDDYLNDEEMTATKDRSSRREMQIGRLSFNQVLSKAPPNSEVFFCGAPNLQWKVEVACARHNLSYHPGHKFSSEGGIAFHRVGKTKCVCRCSKFPFCWNY